MAEAWYYNVDVIFTFVAMLIALAVSIYSLKVYSFSGKKKYYYFGFGFLIIALGYFIRGLFDYLIKSKDYGRIDCLTGLVVVPSALQILLLIYAGCVLVGLVTIITVIYEEKKIPIIFLLFLLAGTGVFISSSIYIAFHLFAFIFLLLITLYFAKNFLENPGMLSGTVGAGFGLIMLSQVFFLLIGTSGLFYLLGHVFRLVGFIFLLVNYVLVLKK